MQQFQLLNKTLRSIFTKLTHRACNSPRNGAILKDFYNAVELLPEYDPPSNLVWAQFRLQPER